MTDGLEQYHKLARDQEGITNANCMAHARRHFANAIKAAGAERQEIHPVIYSVSGTCEDRCGFMSWRRA